MNTGTGQVQLPEGLPTPDHITGHQLLFLYWERAWAALLPNTTHLSIWLEPNQRRDGDAHREPDIMCRTLEQLIEGIEDLKRHLGE